MLVYQRVSWRWIKMGHGTSYSRSSRSSLTRSMSPYFMHIGRCPQYHLSGCIWPCSKHETSLNPCHSNKLNYESLALLLPLSPQSVSSLCLSPSMAVRFRSRMESQSLAHSADSSVNLTKLWFNHGLTMIFVPKLWGFQGSGLPTFAATPPRWSWNQTWTGGEVYGNSKW